MAESKTITAPKLLESGVNFFTEYSKKFETESLTGQSLFEYIQTFSEVKGWSYTEIVGEKNIKVAWQKLTNKGFLKNYGDTNNLNTFFKNFPELSVAQR